MKNIIVALHEFCIKINRGEIDLPEAAPQTEGDLTVRVNGMELPLAIDPETGDVSVAND